MIYAVGLETDKTLQHFVRASEGLAEVQVIDLDETFNADWCFALQQDEPAARSSHFDNCDPDAAYYVRPVDLSPVLMEPWNSQWRAMLAGLSAYLECVKGPVANRPGGHTHNSAKPLHEAWLQSRGFDIPPAITTADKDQIEQFLDENDGAICKTLCGVRATARYVTAKDFADFDPRQGPVHLQRLVSGDDVRVHVIGEKAHGELIRAEGVDYRDTEVDSVHTPVGVDESLVKRMAVASEEMGLALTGWDFKIDQDGRWWCLEVNPMPGYDGYDRRCDGAITRSIVEWLSDG